ncbi:MAG: hypothetical protein Q7R93_03515 [bacterium]|nr:hypothetical protein [bacterium]
MTNALKKYKIEISLFLLAFLIRFAYAVVVQTLFGSHVFISFSDAEMYLHEAGNLLNYHTLSQAFISPSLLPDPLRTIGYPLFLSIFVWLKAPLLLIVSAQNILVGLMAVMVYRMGVTIFASRTVGIIAGILFSIEPMSIYWNNLLMSDTLASFLFLLAVYLFVSERYYSSAVAMGLAALTRSVNLYLFPLFLVMYIYRNRAALFSHFSDWSNRALAWRKVLLIGLVFFATLSPWLIRNKLQFDTWQLTSNGWFAIHYFPSAKFAESHGIPYLWPKIPNDYYHGPNREVYYYFDFVNVPFYKQYFSDLVSAYPIDYFRFHILSAVKGFDNHDYGYIMKYVLLAKLPQFNESFGEALVIIGRCLWFFAYGFLIFGFFAKGKRDWQFFLLSFYLANNLLTGYISTVSAGGRYNLPFLALTLLSVSYGYVSIATVNAKRVKSLKI